MTPFFRRIRKKLANENKPMKYLRYAIGEIVLVVIGILIALQINNLNEQRKNNNRSQVYIDKIINDIATDTININELIELSKIYETNVENYFSYFNQGNIPIDKLIDSARNVSARYFRYFPINNTFLDMQYSGNSSLLSDEQQTILVDLSSEQEMIQIIIEKTVSSAILQSNASDNYLGFPIDFYEKLGKTTSEENKTKWLIHQHLQFDKNSQLYEYMELRGNRIKEKSKLAIEILKK